MLKLHIALLGLVLVSAPLAAAPYLVKDLNRGPADPGSVLLYDSAAVGSVLYFPGFDPAHGTELWRSDGTADGTYRLTDVCPGRCGSTPANVSAVGGKVYFQADDGIFGVELWVSDGVPGHERRVRDLCPGPCDSHPEQMIAVGQEVLFFVQLGQRTQLWRTDGTRAGTARVATLCIQAQECVGFDSLRSIGTRAFFEVFGAATIELWATDGTAAGTFEVKALSELLPAGSASDRTDYFHAVAGGLLYTVLGSGDLVRSDGTAAGTFLLHKFTNGSAVSALIPLADRVLLALDDTPGRRRG